MFRTIYSSRCVRGSGVITGGVQRPGHAVLPGRATGNERRDAGGRRMRTGFHRGPFGVCVGNGPVVVAPAVVVAPPVVVAPGLVVAPPVVCGAGFRWHPRFRRCVVL